MPNTYVALRTETVAVATPSVTFSLSGISGYTDLVVVSNLRYSSGSPSGNAYFRFNSDSGTNYSRTFLQGDGTSATSGRASNENGLYVLGNTATASVFTTNITQIQNYSNTTTNKTVLSRWSNAGDFALAFVGLWRSTAAITSIDIFASGTTNFAVGSTFSLYGIANADQGAAKATGGIITEDSQYWYHTFGASGAFIPKQSLTCDYLVVGAGGGSGGFRGGGGGAGGVSLASATLSATSYSVVVGGGGTAGSSSDGTASGGAGNLSSFNSTSSSGGGLGGGGGTSGQQDPGGNGASGGGGGGSDSGTGAAGGTGSQGTNGGSGGTGNRMGGGGGGFLVAGAAGAGGGNGTSVYSSWGIPTGVGQNVSGTVWFAGGGGGGSGQNAATTGGNGGGGAGAFKAAGNPGLPNTGGGAGGGARNEDTGAGFAGAAGGSGVVIIRYSK